MATKQSSAAVEGQPNHPGPGRMAPRLETLDGVRLGLLSTGKRNCDELLAEIASVLGEEHRFAEVRSWLSNPKRKRGLNAVPSASSLTLRTYEQVRRPKH